MKKLVCTAIALALAFTAIAALAEPATYTDRSKDFTLTYEADDFEITTEEYQADDDDNLVLVLGGKNEAWGEVFIRFIRTELDTDADLKAHQDAEAELIAGVGATKGEWNGFHDVLMYAIEDEECTEQSFVISCSDDETMAILVHVENIEDEEAIMERDDQISAVLGSLTFIEDDDD